jgi:soluble lytic murein transglycosylase-like protein
VTATPFARPRRAALLRTLRTSTVAACAILFVQSPALADCFDDAGRKYAIDPTLLRAIADAESGGNPRAIHRNRDGTLDMGIMQINSSQFPSLRKRGITPEMLLTQPCLNVDVGASILAGMVRQHGFTWRAVGSYAAGNRPGLDRARIDYAQKVAAALARNTAPAHSQPPIARATGVAMTRMKVFQ